MVAVGVVTVPASEPAAGVAPAGASGEAPAVTPCVGGTM